MGEGQLMSIGSRIRTARMAIGLSQLALAEKAGFPKARVGQWECGNRNPGVEPLTALADALGVSFSWLALGRGAPSDTEQPNGALLEACVEIAMASTSPEPLPSTVVRLYAKACAAGLGLRRDAKADLLVAVRALASL